ncbi:MAG TPA: hypothetical protein VJP80_04335 [Candidatus Saccharimonadales bacterium]|nr:hypothetical protein [Candidatus Saccharimonadales bacterium]
MAKFGELSGAPGPEEYNSQDPHFLDLGDLVASQAPTFIVAESGAGKTTLNWNTAEFAGGDDAHRPDYVSTSRELEQIGPQEVVVVDSLGVRRGVYEINEVDGLYPRSELPGLVVKRIEEIE